MTNEDFILQRITYDPASGKLFKDGKEVRARHTHGYTVVNVAGNAMLAHRVGWFLHHGAWPELHLDHIDGDPSNNRIVNLREATVSQNQGNQRLSVRNTSGFKGVMWAATSRKWMAQIRKNGKSTYLGVFETKEAAHAAYCAAAEQVFGEFARAA